MPRRDRTFTDLDILRLIRNNLDAVERANVLRALQELPPPEEPPSTDKTSELAADVLELIKQILPPLDAALFVAEQIQNVFGPHPFVVQNIARWEFNMRQMEDMLAFVEPQIEI